MGKTTEMPIWCARICPPLSGVAICTVTPRTQNSILRFVIAVFPDHTHLLFLIIQTLITRLCRFKLDIFIILSDKKSVLHTLWALKRTILLRQLF